MVRLRVRRRVTGDVVAYRLRQLLVDDLLPSCLKGGHAELAGEPGQGGWPGSGQRAGELVKQDHAPDVPLQRLHALSAVLCEKAQLCVGECHAGAVAEFFGDGGAGGERVGGVGAPAGGGCDPVPVANVRWLAGYRHPWHCVRARGQAAGGGCGSGAADMPDCQGAAGRSGIEAAALVRALTSWAGPFFARSSRLLDGCGDRGRKVTEPLAPTGPGHLTGAPGYACLKTGAGRGDCDYACTYITEEISILRTYYFAEIGWVRGPFPAWGE
jgi:hypothetical protein